MSGYRAAPRGARLTVYGIDPPWVYVVRPSGAWYDERAADAPVRKMLGLALDHAYWSRIDAIESAAQACEQLGREAQDIGECIYSRGCRDAAAAIRKLKEST